jgi:hypothetical protein
MKPILTESEAKSLVSCYPNKYRVKIDDNDKCYNMLQRFTGTRWVDSVLIIKNGYKPGWILL